MVVDLAEANRRTVRSFSLDASGIVVSAPSFAAERVVCVSSAERASRVSGCEGGGVTRSSGPARR